MTLTAEDLEKFFPYYLTVEQKEGLAKALTDFDGSRSSFYASSMFADLAQGDCLENLDIIDLESGRKGKVRGIVISNTCDVSTDNSRDLPVRLMFAPIIKLSSYAALLRRAGKSEASISDKCAAIWRQRVSNLFHLPSGPSIDESFVAVLDDMRCLPLKLYKRDSNPKVFSLDLLGFYLLLFKLSIHFCRIHEDIDRPLSA